MISLLRSKLDSRVIPTIPKLDRRYFEDDTGRNTSPMSQETPTTSTPTAKPPLPTPSISGIMDQLAGGLPSIPSPTFLLEVSPSVDSSVPRESESGSPEGELLFAQLTGSPLPPIGLLHSQPRPGEEGWSSDLTKTTSTQLPRGAPAYSTTGMQALGNFVW